MQRLLRFILVLAMMVPIAACQPTVSSEGYVSETPVQSYKRNFPKGYSGQRQVVLKPPAASASLAMDELAATPNMNHDFALSRADGMSDLPSSDVPAPAYDGSPVLNNVMPYAQGADAPSPLATREVSYGKAVTIYPLDSADAAMPYIPPAANPPVPHKAKPIRQQKASGYNQ